MSDATTDDKIARLVHLVLEAVDHRLADIRVELQQLDDRLGAVERSAAQVPGRAAPAPLDDDRVERLRAEIDRVRGLVESLAARPAQAPAAPATSPAPASVAPTAPAPVAHATLSPLDTTLPTLPSLASVTSPPLPSLVDEIPTAPPTDESELIDLDRLSDLLSARLSQLHLPGAT